MDQRRERTIRRALYGTPRSAILAVPPGFRESARREAARIIADPWHPDAESAPPEDDGPHLIIRDIDLRLLLEILFRSSSLQDVRLIVAEGRVTATRGTAALCRSVDWRLYLPRPSRVSVTVRTTESRASHKRGIREEIARVLNGFGIEVAADAAQRLFADVHRNRMRLSLSLAGEPLPRRGYRRTLKAAAPLREDIARCSLDEGLLFAARQGVRPSRLSIPFSGGGTFLFEYLIRAAEIPPCLFPREYAVDTLPFAPSATLAWLRRRARRTVRSLPGFSAFVSDVAGDALEAARTNWDCLRDALGGTPLFGSADGESAQDAGPQVRFGLRDFFAGSPAALIPPGGGDLFLPLNPPYGIRLAGETPAVRYAEIGRAVERLSRELARDGHRLAGLVLCPGETAWRAFLSGIRGMTRETRHISQGGLDIRLCLFAAEGRPGTPRIQNG